MRKLLERLGYRITVANTVGRPSPLRRASRIDLVISDIGLPDGSGLDLIRRLNDVAPVTGIALSGFGWKRTSARARKPAFTST
jgi:DNA-binding response OmpR family regulator